MNQQQPGGATTASVATIRARLAAIRLVLPFGDQHTGRRADMMAARALQALDDADVLLGLVDAQAARLAVVEPLVEAATLWAEVDQQAALCSECVAGEYCNAHDDLMFQRAGQLQAKVAAAGAVGAGEARDGAV